MTKSSDKQRKLMKETTDQSLTKLADAAFEQASRKVIERAQRSGTPVIIWEEGTMKEVEPREIPRTRNRDEDA